MTTRKQLFAALVGASTFCGISLAQDYVAKDLLSACMTDLGQYCAGTDFGGGAFVRCLQENAATLKAECKKVVMPDDGPEGTASVEVTVTGSNSDTGTMFFMLTDDAQRFPSGRRIILLPSKSGSVVGVFRHLKPGTYAITAFLDLNGNNVMDRGDKPAEAFASINLSGQPSTFENSSMKVSGDMKLTLALRYY